MAPPLLKPTEENESMVAHIGKNPLVANIKKPRTANEIGIMKGRQYQSVSSFWVVGY